MKRTLLAAVAAAMVACEGDTGPQGTPGATGPAGPVGPVGASGVTVTSNTVCDTDPGPAGGLVFLYQRIDFSSGDSLALCAIVDGFSQFSGHLFSDTGICFVVFDLEVDAPTGGTWIFTLDSVTYNDPTSPNDGITAAFGPENCTEL